MAADFASVTVELGSQHPLTAGEENPLQTAIVLWHGGGTGDGSHCATGQLHCAGIGEINALGNTSDVLTAPLRIAGPIVDLWVFADVPDTDLVLRLTDVDPAGRPILIQVRCDYATATISPPPG